MNYNIKEMIIIKLENLKVGMFFKNYKELCKVLEVKPLSGNSKKAQMRWFALHFTLEQIGYSFTVKEILTTEVQPKPTRGGANNNIERPNFKVDEDNWNSIGVYKIVLNRDIYIGSTIDGFRRRFLNHTYEYSKSLAKNIIDNGGEFTIIKVCNDMDEPKIREIENKWINYYKNHSQWNLINKNDAWSFTEPKPRCKPEYKMIMVENKRYEDVIKLLQGNDIKYKKKYVRKIKGE